MNLITILSLQSILFGDIFCFYQAVSNKALEILQFPLRVGSVIYREIRRKYAATALISYYLKLRSECHYVTALLDCGATRITAV